MMMEIREEGDWAPFASIGDHGVFPAWFTQSLAEIIAGYPEPIRMITVDLWVTPSSDRKYHFKRGDIYITLVDPKNPLDQDQLDRIPAMRRLSRKTKDLWLLLPVRSDEESESVNGEMSLIVHRDGIDFQINHWDDEVFEASLLFQEDRWVSSQKIIFHQAISETARALFDATTALEYVALGALGFDHSKVPTPRSAAIDEDGWITLEFEEGLFESFENESSDYD